MNGRRALVAAAAFAAFVALLGANAGSGLAVDALWFAELGLFDVFRTTLAAKLACFGVAFAVAVTLFVSAGLYAIAQTVGRSQIRVVFRRGDGAETLPELIAPVSDRIPWRGLVVAIAAVLALLFAAAEGGQWRTMLLWLYGGSYGAVDPLFGRDVGFYLFALPALRLLLDAGMGLLVLAAILGGVVFWLRGALDFRRPAESIAAAPIRALSLLLGVFFLLKAGGYWLGRYELLLAPSGVVFGAGYTTAHLRLPFQWLLCATALVAAALCFANMAARGWRMPVGGVVALFAAAILSSILPDVVQRLRVRPDELRLERPYIGNNLAMTRRAYGLDAVQARPFPAAEKLDASAIERNRATLSNIRLWDPRPLLDSYRQLQVIRLYYDFDDIDVDRYDLPGGRRQVMVAAREIVPGLLPPTARTWVNERLQFTHGFGAVMSPVTEFEGEGLPRFFLKDIPPRSSVGIEVTEPRIYFGERTDDYVIVNGAAAEFDYPKGDENVTNRYSGKGGVVVGSWLRRLLFAWAFRDLNLLISTNIRPDSRILFRRAIGERIARLAPFLRLDQDPYVVVSGGRLYFIQDAYTTADTFPYSEPFPGGSFNYIRNSVKIVVDAYDGTVGFYAVDAAEPVYAAWARIFPALFRPLASMPDDLRRHLRYPEDLFLVQAAMYRAYHMTSADVFYNKEDLWSFPSQGGTNRPTVEPYYVIMKLPGGEREEFILMQPMTPSNRSNMVSWLAARCDPEHYGELVEYAFPKERLIYGPQQIEARIDQDTTISQQLSLWNQRGSKVIRGNLLVIPIEDSLIYVEPLYLRSDQGQIPELKRVVVSYGDRVVMESSLDAALKAVFEGAAPPAAAAPSAGVEKQAAQARTETAREHYRAALDRLRAGDWPGFGGEMDALGKALEAER